MFLAKQSELMKQAIIVAGEELLTNGPDASMNLIRQAIGKMPLLNSEKRSRDLSETTDAFEERYHSRALNKGKILGIRMGLPELDLHTKGLMPQWLTVIQGRNGQFKSWVLSHMIKTLFIEDKKTILVFSCEMSLEEFETRIHALALGVQPTLMQNGELPYGDYNRMQAYLEDVKQGKYGRLIINDNPGDLDMIAMEVEKHRQMFPIDAICIDAAYGLAAPGKSDTERYSNIAKGCKMLAKKFEIPVTVTIQANRDFAKANPTAKKETTGSGMSAYGSDAWNQYADLMFIIHRTPDHAPFHFSDFIMDKFRHGPVMDSMLRINLKEPIICETNRDAALARIKGENPTAQGKTDKMFEQANKLFSTDFGFTLNNTEEEETENGND